MEFASDNDVFSGINLNKKNIMGNSLVSSLSIGHYALLYIIPNLSFLPPIPLDFSFTFYNHFQQMVSRFDTNDNLISFSIIPQ